MAELTIVKPSAVIRKNPADREAGIEMLRDCEWAGRISHRAEGRQTDDSYDRFIRTWTMERGDWSYIEHEKVTCLFEIDRGLTHELVRHRVGSYTQESTRFVRYVETGLAGRPRWICPPEIEAHTEMFRDWYMGRQADQDEYDNYLTNGFPPEDARGAFGHYLAAQIVVTYNLRQWRHFFLFRTSKETHHGLREVTVPLLAEFQARIPILYDDIVPNTSQRINARMNR